MNDGFLPTRAMFCLNSHTPYNELTVGIVSLSRYSIVTVIDIAHILLTYGSFTVEGTQNVANLYEKKKKFYAPNILILR